MTKGEGGQKSQKIDDVFYEWPLGPYIVHLKTIKNARKFVNAAVLRLDVLTSSK